jgi:hypothetical protein
VVKGEKFDWSGGGHENDGGGDMEWEYETHVRIREEDM